jgi:Helix-turn-helix domain
MNVARFLSRSEASDYLVSRGLHIARQTLAKFAVTGEGPAYRSFGRRVVYDPADLDAWIDATLTNVRRSTSATFTE